MQIGERPEQLNAGGTNFGDIGKVREIATGVLVGAQKDFAVEPLEAFQLQDQA